MSAPAIRASRDFYSVVWAGVAYVSCVIACLALLVGGPAGLILVGMFAAAAAVAYAGSSAIAVLIS